MTTKPKLKHTVTLGPASSTAKQVNKQNLHALPDCTVRIKQHPPDLKKLSVHSKY